MRKREIKPYTKKKSIIVLSIGILGIVLSIVLILIAVILHDKGVSDNTYSPLYLITFIIILVDLIFVFYHFPGVISRDVNNKIEKIAATGYEIYEKVPEDIYDYCKNNQFTLTEEGYYHKKKFSLYKDYINFYIKKIYSHNLLDTINTQQDKFDSYQLKRHHKCFILFVEMENLTEEDLKILEETQHAAIIFSLPNMINDVKMVVLIDTTKHCTYLVPPGKNNYSTYKAGYKLIKKIITESTCNEKDNAVI